MATTTNILSLLKFFASKQKSGVIDFGEFCSYLKKYSEHHLEEQPLLACYLEDTVGSFNKELDKLVESKQVVISETANEKRIIHVIPYFIEKFADRYKEIETTPNLPFPTIADLPKLTPKTIVTTNDAAFLVNKFLDSQELNDKTLYGLALPNDEPVIILPSNVSMIDLVENSLAKVQYMLKKEGYHDYFLKKLTGTNPGKELTAKNFFNKFVDRPDHGVEILSESIDDFYLWHQLCYFIKQDYKKVKDYTQEDISTIQAIMITELAANYYKTKAMDKSKRDNALKALEILMNKPPYYFTYEAITKFVDTKGHLLLGEYTEQELKDWLHEQSTGGDARSLPNLLIFKMEDDKKYFIFKSKVLQLVIRLCTDARDIIRNSITDHWYSVLKNFGSLPEMHNQEAFEAMLQMEVREQTPLLYSLLTASFLPLLTYEKFGEEDGGNITLFVNGNLIPYSELLLMNRHELMTDSKMKLPFWYTVPVVSWIAKLLFRPKKSKTSKKPKTEAQLYQEKEEKESIENIETNSMISKNSNMSKKLQLKEAARDIEKILVPSSSTLDRELSAYEREWNKKLGVSRTNLTEDVNSLIRDYVRKTLRSIASSGLTHERIKNLSNTLVKTSAMMKIGEAEALEHYIQLYMLKLIKNIPTHAQIESQFK